MMYAVFFIGGYLCALLCVFVVAYMTRPINAGRGEVRVPHTLNKPKNLEDMI
jgi:hypothetical protein